jgi:hypothetical protein
LGISTGGVTADKLFPNTISKEGLAQSIARVQGYEQQMIASLKKGSGTSSPTGGSTYKGFTLPN